MCSSNLLSAAAIVNGDGPRSTSGASISVITTTFTVMSSWKIPDHVLVAADTLETIPAPFGEPRIPGE